MTNKFDLDAHLRDPKTQADLRADLENITWMHCGGSADRGPLPRPGQHPAAGMAGARPRAEPAGAPPRELPRRVSTIGAAPVPRPLPASLFPVAPFDLSLMPEKLRPWAGDLAERMQCPADYIGVSLMVSAAAVIGRKIAIRPMMNDDWTVICNQWALIIGRPGVLKSPAMEASMKAVGYLAAQAGKKFGDEKAKYDLNAELQKIKREALKEEAKKRLKKNADADVSALLASDDELAPTAKRYIANDTTVESVGMVLQQNPNGVLVFRDEVLSLLDHLDLEQNASQKGFYLTGWNGDSSYTFDRVGRGLNLNIEAVCLSMLGSTQPGRIAPYLAAVIHGGKHDDGLIQRFGLMVWPDVPADWNPVDRLPDAEARRIAYEIFERLDALDWRAVQAQRDRGRSGDEEGIPYLRFDAAGYERFKDWRGTLERRLRSGDLHPALESHLAKYRKLIPGIALVCHLADGGTGPVTDDAVRRAIAWGQYLETHARRVYGSVTAVAGDTARAILGKIWDGSLPPGFTARDIKQKNWSRLAHDDDVRAGLDLLVEHDWLVEGTVKTGGRPKTTYTLSSHPAAAKPAAK
jgi:putative DNA primase/helicase